MLQTHCLKKIPATAKNWIKLKNNLKGTLNSSDIKTIKEHFILG